VCAMCGTSDIHVYIFVFRSGIMGTYVTSFFSATILTNEQQETVGWLQPVDSFKSWVSFSKETCKRDHILQKRPVILRSLLIVVTPYLHKNLYKRTSINIICATSMCGKSDTYVDLHILMQVTTVQLSAILCTCVP